MNPYIFSLLSRLVAYARDIINFKAEGRRQTKVLIYRSDYVVDSVSWDNRN